MNRHDVVGLLNVYAGSLGHDVSNSPEAESNYIFRNLRERILRDRDDLLEIYRLDPVFVAEERLMDKLNLEPSVVEEVVEVLMDMLVVPKEPAKIEPVANLGDLLKANLHERLDAEMDNDYW